MSEGKPEEVGPECEPRGASVRFGDEPESALPSADASVMEVLLALRHDVKMHVRSSRGLQQAMQEGWARLEQRVLQLTAAQPTNGAPGREEGRNLAEAIAEVEESLQRAVEVLDGQSLEVTFPARVEVLDIVERQMAQSSWWVRWIARREFAAMRAALATALGPQQITDAGRETARQGLRLLLARVHRLMEQCAIEREDVVGWPFDAEVMQAVDFMDSSDVRSSHVAQQLRPVYRWRGKVLLCAQVRLAK